MAAKPLKCLVWLDAGTSLEDDRREGRAYPLLNIPVARALAQEVEDPGLRPSFTGEDLKSHLTFPRRVPLLPGCGQG